MDNKIPVAISTYTQAILKNVNNQLLKMKFKITVVYYFKPHFIKKYHVYGSIQRPLLILLNKKHLKLLWNTDMNQFPNKQSDLQKVNFQKENLCLLAEFGEFY